MLKGKLDIKTMLILILGVILVLVIIFRPSKSIKMYEDEINSLNQQNTELLQNNDSLEQANTQLDSEIEEYLVRLDSTQVLLDENKDKINDLENGKNEVSSYVNGLDANGVTSSLTDYLNRRKD